MPSYAVQAYIRNCGALVDSVFLSVAAPNKDAAHNLIREYYAGRGLDAGINTDSTREIVDFGRISNT